MTGPVEHHMPRDLALSFCHPKFRSGARVSFLPLFEPIQRISVFLLLSLKLETSPKSSNTLRAAESESCEPLSIKAVSPACWLSLISPWFTKIPLMFQFLRNALARISTERMKRYGDNGQHCLTPLSILKKNCLSNHFSRRSCKSV